jgi:hypothetical protein
MRPALSFIVLLLLGVMVSEAMAQRNPQRPNPNPNRPGQQQPIPPLPPVHVPQQSSVISERIMLNIPSFQRVQIAGLLRQQRGASASLPVRSISLSASSAMGAAGIEILSHGRPLAMEQTVRRQLTQVHFELPVGSELAELELFSRSEIFIDTINVEVVTIPHRPHLQLPLPGERIKLAVNQNFSLSADISLEQMVQQQFGLTLRGVQIERVTVLGAAQGFGATMQLVLNDQLIGPTKPLRSNAATPFPVVNAGPVHSDLRLIIRGQAFIQQILVVVSPLLHSPIPHRIPRPRF